MIKQDYKNVLLKTIFGISFLMLCFLILPISAQAFDVGSLYENKPFESGDPSYYVDADSESYWVVSENKWHKCIYDNSNYDAVTAGLRQAMYDREDQYFVYFLVGKKATADNINKIFEKVNEQVYKDNKTPYGGDYLSFLSEAEMNSKSGLLNTSSSSKDYNFYRLTVDIQNETTKAEEKMVSSYLEQFNKIYIENNETIKKSKGDERQYYIVKTIYNFLVKNTTYDFDVYMGKINENAERFRFSHTAYGALFGNIDGAYNPNSFDIDKSIDLSYQVDSQGLYRIGKRNQGRSVCDGYSLVFYYLCKLNGIDCRIVEGDFTQDKEHPIDPHAWNMVYLKDFDDPNYTWYAVDATYAAQKSEKISDNFTIVNYSYLLKGSENKDYYPENHQQRYSDYKSIAQSKSDYGFEIGSISENSLYTVVTRRREEDANKTYVDTGVYNLENYLIIDPDGRCFKVDENNTDSFIEVNGFTFYSTGYYYSCNFYDFASGIEYTCEDRFIHDADTYYFYIQTMQGNKIYKKRVVVSPLDMSDWTKYDSRLIPQQATFKGEDITVAAEIIDNSMTQLISGKDYDMICYLKSDTKKTSIKPFNPGEYIVKVVYKGNYTGVIEVPYTVLKADFAAFTQSNINATYGIDISKGLSTLKLGDTTLVSGTDYKVEIVGSLNYGSSGKIKITGLASSKYVKSGSVTIWTYTINQRRNIASLFNNQLVTSTKYTYTGKEIKPSDFKLSFKDSVTGKTINLVKGTDYKITSYSNNIYGGTATVNVEFIGNYTGKAAMKFYIQYGKLSITCPELTYTGKNQTAKPVVKVGNVTLKNGTDYKVTGTVTATNPGIYQGKITGIGKFANVISGSFIYYINPGALSGVKSSTTQSSITVSWKKQGSNCIYEVWVYDTGKKSWTKLTQTSGTSYKITNVYVNGKKTAVKANTQYKIRVRAVLKGTVNGKSITKNGPVNNLTIRTNPKKLTAKVAKSGSNNLKVSWNKDSTVTGYQVYLSTSSDFKKGVKSTTVKKNSTTAYTFKNLKKGTTYYVRVRSYKTVGNKPYYSAYSTVVKIKR